MLAVILGHSEMMLLDETLPSKYRVHLKAIQTAGHRSAAMTQQLLTFARRQNASPQKVNINKAVERMLDLLRKSMGEKIEVEWMAGEGTWTVNIDPVQLDQILANLCINLAMPSQTMAGSCCRREMRHCGRLVSFALRKYVPGNMFFCRSQILVAESARRHWFTSV